MRTIIFIGALLAMGYVAYLQMNVIKENDLDKASNRITQTEDKVNKLVEDYQDKLEKKMP